MNENMIVSKGRLYEEFKKTIYYEDLKRFIDEQTELCKDQTVKRTIEGKYEEAKEYAFKLSGYQSIVQYIEEAIISARIEEDSEREEHEYQKSIPRHV